MKHNDNHKDDTLVEHSASALFDHFKPLNEIHGNKVTKNSFFKQALDQAKLAKILKSS